MAMGAAQRIGVAFVPRAVFAFLIVAFVLSLAALGSAAVASDGGAAYVAALSASIALVASYHYHEIVKIRTAGVSGWLRVEGEGEGEADAELQVAALRMSDWFVTMPILVLKFYAVLGRSSFGDGYDSLWHSQDMPALLSMVMVGLGAIVRIGFDDFKKLDQWWMWVVAGICYLGALACLGLLIQELYVATEAAPDSFTLRGFFWVWCGYPVTSIVCMLLSVCKLDGTWAVIAFTDFAYGLLDVYSKVFFIFLTCSVHFGVPFLSWESAIPLNLNR